MNRRTLLKQIIASGASLVVLNESLMSYVVNSEPLVATLTLNINSVRFGALKNINGYVEITDSIAPGIQVGLQAMYPLALVRVNTTTIAALEKYCMHQGCEIGKYDGTKFLCPCHGSQYTSSGAVLKGPTTLPLKNYPTTLVGDILTTRGLPGNTSWNVTSVDETSGPSTFELRQNYPNPFGSAMQCGNSSTRITYVLGMRVYIRLNVFDSSGKVVATLVDQVQDIGVHEIEFDASQLSGGTYFYTLRAGNFVESKQMILLK